MPYCVNYQMCNVAVLFEHGCDGHTPFSPQSAVTEIKLCHTRVGLHQNHLHVCLLLLFYSEVLILLLVLQQWPWLPLAPVRGAGD